MATSILKVTNIPVYIAEPEFKRVWNQQGLECQSCNFVKGINGEHVGYLQFSSPQAAARVQQMYHGWQGYGNPEGIRLEFAEQGGGRGKRDREENGVDGQGFKQSRLNPGNGMGFGSQGGGFQAGAPLHLGQNGPGDAYDPLRPGMGSDVSNSTPLRFSGLQSSHPPEASAFGGQSAGMQLPKPAYPGSHAQQPQAMTNAPNGVASSQSYSLPSSAAFHSFAPREGQQQQVMVTQQPQLFGNQQVDLSQNPVGFLQGFQQAPQQQQQQQQQPGVPSQVQGFQNQPQGFSTESLDPRLQPQQQPAPTAHSQPQQQAPAHQLQPQQVASLADVLGPLLQQAQAGGGAPNLGFNLGLLAGQQPNTAQLGGVVNQLQQHLSAQQPLPQQQQQQQYQAPPQQQQQFPQFQGQQPPVQLPPPVQHPPGGVSHSQDGFASQEPLPADACQTLYVDGMPVGTSKREMAHIFRAFEGYKEIRMVDKKDKHGNQLAISFVEFETAMQANIALKALQGYPMDLERPSESSLRVCFARPLKQNDPRSRAPQQGRPVQGPGGGEGLRLTGNRGERHVTEPSPGYRTGRDRDRKERGPPRRGFSNRPAERERRMDDRRPSAERRR